MRKWHSPLPRGLRSRHDLSENPPHLQFSFPTSLWKQRVHTGNLKPNLFQDCWYFSVYSIKSQKKKPNTTPKKKRKPNPQTLQQVRLTSNIWFHSRLCRLFVISFNNCRVWDWRKLWNSSKHGVKLKSSRWGWAHLHVFAHVFSWLPFV